jgi:Zn-dependent M28 family amino/carboxypeptidase
VTSNIFAETISAQTDNVVVVGSHLDSVPAGAGINDNGSGSAVNLELALTLSQCLVNPINRVRFAWWAAEELGLLGSRHYVDDLVKNNPSGLADIILNLNFDMIGSPNFFYGIYNGSGAAPEIRQRSVLIQNQFEAAVSRQNKPYDLTPFSGRSDYGPFIENGVAAGGLFSGAEEVKNAAGRSKFTGIANTAYDPCYHDYCDSFENINVEGLTTLANAAYSVTNYFVSSYRASEKSKPLGKPHFFEPHPYAISHY